uniref:Uncharacterized protein n=1 Tax=Clastoptera arizonana TaxID=38151 RepID=A0A1B6E2V9_9HEMI
MLLAMQNPALKLPMTKPTSTNHYKCNSLQIKDKSDENLTFDSNITLSNKSSTISINSILAKGKYLRKEKRIPHSCNNPKPDSGSSSPLAKVNSLLNKNVSKFNNQQINFASEDEITNSNLKPIDLVPKNKLPIRSLIDNENKFIPLKKASVKQIDYRSLHDKTNMGINENNKLSLNKNDSNLTKPTETKLPYQCKSKSFVRKIPSKSKLIQARKNLNLDKTEEKRVSLLQNFSLIGVKKTENVIKRDSRSQPNITSTPLQKKANCE